METNPMKAWKVRCCKISNEWAIGIGSSAGKARYCGYLSAKDAGYNVSITDIQVLRAREFDDATYCGKPLPENTLISAEYVKAKACA